MECILWHLRCIILWLCLVKVREEGKKNVLRQNLNKDIMIETMGKETCFHGLEKKTIVKAEKRTY